MSKTRFSCLASRPIASATVTASGTPPPLEFPSSWRALVGPDASVITRSRRTRWTRLLVLVASARDALVASARDALAVTRRAASCSCKSACTQGGCAPGGGGGAGAFALAADACSGSLPCPPGLCARSAENPKARPVRCFDTSTNLCIVVLMCCHKARQHSQTSALWQHSQTSAPSLCLHASTEAPKYLQLWRHPHTL